MTAALQAWPGKMQREKCMKEEKSKGTTTANVDNKICAISKGDTESVRGGCNGSSRSAGKPQSSAKAVAEKQNDNNSCNSKEIGRERERERERGTACERQKATAKSTNEKSEALSGEPLRSHWVD